MFKWLKKKEPEKEVVKIERPDNFKKMFDRIISSEGGYTNSSKDRGNWTTGIIGKGELKGTKYGISAMSYPNLDIKNITLDVAMDIYRHDYYEKPNIHLLPDSVAFQVFDAAVQHGSGSAIKFLQRALGVDVDGIIGEQTNRAAWAVDVAVLVMKFNNERIRFYTSISTWSTYGKGWSNRIADCLRYGSEDIQT